MHLEFSGAFFLAEIFEKVSFDPYNFRITRRASIKPGTWNFPEHEKIKIFFMKK